MVYIKISSQHISLLAVSESGNVVILFPQVHLEMLSQGLLMSPLPSRLTGDVGHRGI